MDGLAAFDPSVDGPSVDDSVADISCSADKLAIPLTFSLLDSFLGNFHNSMKKQ